MCCDGTVVRERPQRSQFKGNKVNFKINDGFGVLCTGCLFNISKPF